MDIFMYLNFFLSDSDLRIKASACGHIMLREPYDN